MKSVHGLLDKLEGVKGRGNNFTARCPAHEDGVSSLSIGVADDKLLVKCHAGCETVDVLARLELKMSDLFLNGGGPKAERKPLQDREIETVYHYADADGRPLFEVVRFRPKGFAQRRPGGEWGLGGLEPVLYHLPEVKAAVLYGDPVFVVEGEKDADNLIGLGKVATTSPMGAGKWRPQYSEVLTGARVVVIPDNDKAGREHAAQIAAGIVDLALSVKVLELPGSAKDVSIWLEDGGTPDEFDNLVAATPPYEPPAEPAAPPVLGGYHLTDMGNAERFVAQYGSIVRYCYERKRWLIWTGKVWQWDMGARVAALAKKTVRTIYNEAAEEADDKVREADARISAMLSLTESEESVPVTVADLDQNIMLFNCQNGTIDLVRGELLSHRRSDMITVMSPVKFAADAEAPLWQSFLYEVTGQDDDLVDFLQRAAGYSLSGDTREQVLFFLYGLGNNGKSTFLAILRKLLAGYGIKASTDLFMTSERHAGGPKEELANLQGKRLVVASEVEANRRLAVVLIKEMTGGEAIRADRKYEHQVEFIPTHKVWIAGNHKPQITDSTLSIWRRVKLIPFTYTVPASQVDATLPQRLEAELSGILRWAVDGCREWHNDGLREPRIVTDATAAYRRDEDALGDFIAERCLLRPSATVTHKALRECYLSWCDGMGSMPVKVRAFKSCLEERGLISDRAAQGVYWHGIELSIGQGVSNVDSV